MINGPNFLIVCICELDRRSNGGESGSDTSVSYFISIGEGEELWEVEDDGHEEEGEGVAQPRLGAQAELKAMDRLLKLPINWRSSDWQIHLGCVESWTGEHLLTSNTLIYALLYIRPEGEIV